MAYSQFAGGQEITVTGTVAESSGSSLPGVNIVIKGTSTGTITNVDGNYSITVPDENSILMFSFVGYLSQEVTVGNQTTIDVTLEAEVHGLDEIVVIGYGTQRKINVTGSVATVQSEELLKAPVTNASDLLMPSRLTFQNHIRES